MASEAKLRSGTGESHSSVLGGYACASDENTLIRQAQTGDWESFAKLAANYDSAVLGLALRLTGSKPLAQELFKQAFLRAYQDLPGYRFQSSFYLWIHRIVMRTCIDFLEEREKPSDGARPPVMLQPLSPRERIVIELKHYFGLRLTTVATILGWSEDMARNVFVRAVTRLRLEREEENG